MNWAIECIDYIIHSIYKISIVIDYKQTKQTYCVMFNAFPNFIVHDKLLKLFYR